MDPTSKALKVVPYDSADIVRGEDGELYHLPTLRALNAVGRLPRESVGFGLLMRQRAFSAPRLTA
ncbi:hypothetical protein V3W47_10315 [Deinococcus sp. YIM 134068]|uniref:hypothetical protein n=1 Tax=Deinococcus lichenicola TaxID=3118910 RepID=UPI002F92BCA8